MTRHVVAAAKECSGTRFVLGGYSQGASVTDIALGIRTTLGRGEAVPAELAPRISAVVVFGNPLRLSRQSVDTASATYGDRALDLCATGDPVCGAGTNFAAHLSYATDGSVGRAAAFAVQKVRAGGSTTPAPPTDPTAPPTSTTAPTTPPSPTVPTTPPSPRTPRWPWVWIWG
jgi:cutinase